MVEPLVHAVGNCAVIKQRCEHLVQGVVQVIQAADVEESFLLAGKRRIGQILRSR